MPTYTGTSGNDSIVGTTSADSINGVAGNDTVYASGGNDSIYGGAGNDIIFGENENDLIYGQDGNDGLVGGENNDTIYGGNGDDLIYGDNADGSGTGQDRLIGGPGTDELHGGAGNDFYLFTFGTDGIDYIYEQSGDYDKLILSNITLSDFRVANGTALGLGASDVVIYSYTDSLDGTLSSAVVIVGQYNAGGAVELINISGTDYPTVDFL
jgi:Ca2+-binding RTX toxin-like protein